MRPRPRPGQGGLTLLETLAALAILALLAGGLFQAMRSALALEDATERELRLTQTAAELLAEAGATLPPRPTRRSGRLPDGWRYTIEWQRSPSDRIPDVEPESQPLQLWRLTVQVETAGGRVLRLSTLRLLALDNGFRL